MSKDWHYGNHSAGRNPAWPQRLQALVKEMHSDPSDSEINGLRSEIWTILTSALTLFCHGHVKSMSSVSPDGIIDLAAEKSLDLLRNLESTTWDLQDRSPLEIKAYVSRVARNGLGDLARQSDRYNKLRKEFEDGTDESRSERFLGRQRTQATDDPTVVREFANDLLACVRDMRPQNAKIWFLRSMMELSSKEIATREDVELSPSHIDVVFSRARASIADCMRSKGHEAGPLPVGAFSIVWLEYRAGFGTQRNKGR